MKSAASLLVAAALLAAICAGFTVLDVSPPAPAVAENGADVEYANVILVRHVPEAPSLGSRVNAFLTSPVTAPPPRIVSSEIYLRIHNRDGLAVVVQSGRSSLVAKDPVLVTGSAHTLRIVPIPRAIALATL